MSEEQPKPEEQEVIQYVEEVDQELTQVRIEPPWVCRRPVCLSDTAMAETSSWA